MRFDAIFLSHRTWDNLMHVFVEEDVKDQAKAAFGYSAVPFYVVFDKVTTILICAYCFSNFLVMLY